MKGELVSRASLSASLREEMYAIMTAQFLGVTRQRFDADLLEKNWVILLRSEDGGVLRGFSTLHVYEERLGPDPIGVVYSGDTVVAPDAGMGSSLSKVWIGAVNTIRREMGLDRLFWLLLTSGYRTYRFLPMYWRDFHPRFDAEMPAATRESLAQLAASRFGACFDERAGIVRFPQPQVLAPGLRGVPAHRMSDPHIAFFARRNPAHEHGDELVCLTALAWSNLTKSGERMWRAGERLFGRDPGHG